MISGVIAAASPVAVAVSIQDLIITESGETLVTEDNVPILVEAS